jgi:hypothetical protein
MQMMKETYSTMKDDVESAADFAPNDAQNHRRQRAWACTSNSPFPCPQTRNFRASLLDFTSLRFDPFFSSSRKFLKAIQITIATKSR